MNIIAEKAYAKINLLLDVLYRRDDGYHEVDMIMQTISLHDEITLTKNTSGISLAIEGADLAADDNNLCCKAARLFFAETGIAAGVDIKLKKNIPLEAGLAGGSADAAAVLRGLNKLFERNITPDQLRAMSAKIGSDIAFCIGGGTARASGRGENIEQLPAFPHCYQVLVKPIFGISTSWAYQQLAESLSTIEHPKMAEMLAAIHKRSVRGACMNMGNVLEMVSVARYPEIEVIKEALVRSGAINAMMSGSGTTVFGVFGDRPVATLAQEILGELFSGQVYLSETQNSYI